MNIFKIVESLRIKADGPDGKNRVKRERWSGIQIARLVRTVSITALIGGGLAGSLAYAVPYSTSWNSGFANAGVVPDANVTGWSDTRTVSGIAENSILDVDVSLHLSGGWNGDLYVYLAHSSGFSILLNRAGRMAGDAFGYGDAGMNVRFDDAAANDSHLYQQAAGYPGALSNGSSWSPDGRNGNPLSTLDTDARTAMLGSFNGLNPNGGWTLFVADLSGGDLSTVIEWSLHIEAGTRGVAVAERGSTLLLVTLALVGLGLSRRHGLIGKQTV